MWTKQQTQLHPQIKSAAQEKRGQRRSNHSKPSATFHRSLCKWAGIAICNSCWVAYFPREYTSTVVPPLLLCVMSFWATSRSFYTPNHTFCTFGWGVSVLQQHCCFLSVSLCRVSESFLGVWLSIRIDPNYKFTYDYDLSSTSTLISYGDYWLLNFSLFLALVLVFHTCKVKAPDLVLTMKQHDSKTQVFLLFFLFDDQCIAQKKCCHKSKNM